MRTAVASPQGHVSCEGRETFSNLKKARTHMASAAQRKSAFNPLMVPMVKGATWCVFRGIRVA
jgi:hypothetical protein